MIDHTEIPLSSIQLNTPVLNLFFPGILFKYGVRYVDVAFDFQSLNNFSAKESDPTMTFNSNVGVKFIVNESDGTSEVAADLLADVAFTFTAAIDGITVKPTVTTAALNSVKTVSSTLGELS